MAQNKKTRVKLEAPKSWWQRLNTGANIGVVTLVLMVLGVIAAFMVVPEVRSVLHLGNAPSPEQTKPQENSLVPQTPKKTQPNDETPRIQYLPLPKQVPFKSPDTWMTSVPKGGMPFTVDFKGEKITVVSQNDVAMMLDQRPNWPLAHKYVGEEPKPVTLFVAIGKDGRVDNVEVASGDPASGEAVKKLVKGWQFKPFVKDGIPVGVQTMMQLHPDDVMRPPGIK